MDDTRRCPDCGSEVPARAAPDGICPRCLLRLGLEGDGRVDTTQAAPSTEDTPSRIGPYRILEKLGEGGMGEVYRAEQEHPIRRTVALKLIKAGMDTKQVVARFEAERQALALMSHPNIARVYEAGSTERGRPFFVMEHVKGVPITDYCDTHRLTTNERLELFKQVCAGVQHAHQKGIIHRDIKPSNVLVGFEDGLPVPKIIDFGVARATEQRLTEKSLFTQAGMLVGTPEYMSPEQAEMTSLDIDTRTDVYALGVLLYELLVGALPFDSRELRLAAFDEICRRIREDEPPKPSVRASTLGGTSAESATRRRTDPTSLVRELSGDLDWITMKALEKDRQRRYASPNELAADVERHLRHEPVTAGAPSAAYRARKFIRRHRVGVGFATLMAAVLVGSTVLLAIQAARIASERDRANEEAATAEQVSEFLVELFEVSDPSEARGNEITAREVLDAGAEKVDVELVDQPRVKARVQHTIGRVYRNLGLYEPAEVLLQGSVDNRRRLLGVDHPATLEAATTLARLNIKQGRYAKAEELYRHVLDSRRRVLGPGDPETLASMTDLGNVQRILGRNDEAETLLANALSSQRRLLDAGDSDLVATTVNLATLHTQQERFDDARPLLLSALENLRATVGDDHPWTLTTMKQLGWLCVKQRRYDEAERWYTTVLEHRRRVLGEDHQDALESASDLANLHRIRGRNERAETQLRQVLETQRRVLDHGDRDLAATLVHLALVYSEQDRSDDADSLLVEAVGILTESVGEDHPDTVLARGFLADSRAKVEVPAP